MDWKTDENSSPSLHFYYLNVDLQSPVKPLKVESRYLINIQVLPLHMCMYKDRCQGVRNTVKL